MKKRTGDSQECRSRHGARGDYERVLSAPRISIAPRCSWALSRVYCNRDLDLGATHACANPLTPRYGTRTRNPLRYCFPVVRLNASSTGSDYAELLRFLTYCLRHDALGSDLAVRLSIWPLPAIAPKTLRPGASERRSDGTREEAAARTGKFNPRPFDAMGRWRLPMRV